MKIWNPRKFHALQYSVWEKGRGALPHWWGDNEPNGSMSKMPHDTLQESYPQEGIGDFAVVNIDKSFDFAEIIRCRNLYLPQNDVVKVHTTAEIC